MAGRGIDHKKLLKGDRRTLSRAITLIESAKREHKKEAEDLVNDLLPHTGKALRIGISGVPGVGKSTFIESFGLQLAENGHKVAVLAVDPSSPVSGGSILGDKTRMEKLSNHPQAFVRPTPSGGYYGGVGQRTREAMLVCEASGHDVVIVETVGVGQSEVEVSDMVDHFMVLLLPGSGDELQGMKKGVVELADAILINKADGDMIKAAERTKADYESALHLLGEDTQKRVFTCSSQKGHGLEEVWNWLSASHHSAEKDGSLNEKRAEQNVRWTRKLLVEIIKEKIDSDSKMKSEFEKIQEKVRRSEITPLLAARKIVELL